MTNSTNRIVNPLASSMGYQLRRATITVTDDLTSRLKPLGLTPNLASILIIADKNTDITQSNISRILHTNRSNISPLVNRLVHDGYLYKKALNDKSHNLLITCKGERLLKEVYKQVEENESHFREAVSPKVADLIIEELPSIWDKNQDQLTQNKLSQRLGLLFI